MRSAQTVIFCNYKACYTLLSTTKWYTCFHVNMLFYWSICREQQILHQGTLKRRAIPLLHRLVHPERTSQLKLMKKKHVEKSWDRQIRNGGTRLLPPKLRFALNGKLLRTKVAIVTALPTDLHLHP